MVGYIVTLKCLFSYSFCRIVFILHTGIKYDITHQACAFFDDRTFWIFGEFLNFWNNGVLYNKCKMPILLQFQSDSFPIAYRHQLWHYSPRLCVFWRLDYFWFFLANFLNFEIVVYYIVNVKCLFSYSFNRIFFILHTGIKYDFTHLGCVFCWRSNYFWIFGEFLKFWNNGVLYRNCKMPLLLQF